MLCVLIDGTHAGDIEFFTLPMHPLVVVAFVIFVVVVSVLLETGAIWAAIPPPSSVRVLPFHCPSPISGTGDDNDRNPEGTT